MSGSIVVNIPGAKLLSSELSKNARIDPRTKARIVKKHRDGAALKVAEAIASRSPVYGLGMKGGRWWAYPKRPGDGPYPVRALTLTRICPERYMADGDNASTLLSATRDGIADALGVNDKVFVDNPTEKALKPGQIAITYEQIAGDWGVRITIEPAL